MVYYLYPINIRKRHFQTIGTFIGTEILGYITFLHSKNYFTENEMAQTATKSQAKTSMEELDSRLEKWAASANEVNRIVVDISSPTSVVSSSFGENSSDRAEWIKIIRNRLSQSYGLILEEIPCSNNTCHFQCQNWVGLYGIMPVALYEFIFDKHTCTKFVAIIKPK
jgi:hypothetical protein